jgi:ribosome-associated protein
MNRAEALARLHELVQAATFVPKKRRPTKPSRSAKKKRVEGKVLRGKIKVLRGKVVD